jgi:hypothetical protein
MSDGLNPFRTRKFRQFWKSHLWRSLICGPDDPRTWLVIESNGIIRAARGLAARAVSRTPETRAPRTSSCCRVAFKELHRCGLLGTGFCHDARDLRAAQKAGWDLSFFGLQRRYVEYMKNDPFDFYRGFNWGVDVTLARQR